VVQSWKLWNVACFIILGDDMLCCVIVDSNRNGIKDAHEITVIRGIGSFFFVSTLFWSIWVIVNMKRTAKNVERYLFPITWYDVNLSVNFTRWLRSTNFCCLVCIADVVTSCWTKFVKDFFYLGNYGHKYENFFNQISLYLCK